MIAALCADRDAPRPRAADRGGRRADHGRPPLLRGPDRRRRRAGRAGGRRDARPRPRRSRRPSPSPRRRRARPDPASPSATPAGTPPASIVPDPTTKPGRAVATRVVVPALKIDLPVVKGNDGYPLCNVAMYLHTANVRASKDAFGQPGEGRATYLYAHARDGMFGPIYELAIQKKQAKKMLGMVVQVYTSDLKLYLYEIRRVPAPRDGPRRPARRHQRGALAPDVRGPQGHAAARRSCGPSRSRSRTPTPRDALPKAKPVKCG